MTKIWSKRRSIFGQKFDFENFRKIGKMVVKNQNVFQKSYKFHLTRQFAYFKLCLMVPTQEIVHRVSIEAF